MHRVHNNHHTRVVLRNIIIVMNIFICGSNSRGGATISASSRSLQRLFEGGYYSKCGVYSRKYGI